MALVGKLIMHIEINSHGHMIHDLIRHKPSNLISISPDKVHGCDIVDGERGAVGSIISWNYTHDGKKKTLKETIEEVDEKNHKLVLKAIEGDLVTDMYKSFKRIFHVEPQEDGRELVILTIEFEKLNTSVPYPTASMDYVIRILKDMDDAHNASK